MSNKAITSNDLKAVLDVVLPPTPSEYRKLLWTNPSPTSSFAAQTISLDLSDYDEIEVEYRRTTTDSVTLVERVYVGETGVTFYVNGTTVGDRRITVTASNVSVLDAYSSNTVHNEILIPLKIYGIKYERVNPPQAEVADVVIEQASTTVGSIHWTYRKWNSGVAECWGYSPTISANCSTAYGYGYYAAAQTNQNFPTDLFIDVPRLIVVPISGDGVIIGVSALTKNGFAYYPYCNSSGNHYVKWDCHAIGWWK